MQKSTPVFLTAKIQVCLFFLKWFCALVVGSTVAVVHEITEPFLSKLIDTIQDCSGIVKEAGGTLTFRLWCCRRLGLWRRAPQWQRGSMGGTGCVYDSVPRCLQVRRRVDGKAGAGDEIDMVFYFHQYIVQKTKIVCITCCVQIKKRTEKPWKNKEFSVLFWYARLDSNQRPSESESDALSSWATGACCLQRITVYQKMGAM